MQLGRQQLNLSTSSFQIVSINTLLCCVRVAGVMAGSQPVCGRCKGQEQGSMAAEITSSKFVAGEMTSSENECDGDSATRSMNNAIILILKPGNTTLPVWS